MIIRETEDAFVMTTQDDHGRFSGDVARGFRRELFMDTSVLEDVLLAITEHDRAWLRMDDTPIWNDGNRQPYTFMDYPVQPKMLMYSKGVDEIEAMSPYAGYLCSLHFASFMKNATEAPLVEFYHAETDRQKRLRAQFQFPDEAVIDRQFRLLQLCDDISLYVTMNAPGASKDQEHPWFKEGFAMSIDGERIKAAWVNEQEIQMRPFLFGEKWSASVKWKYVLKEKINEHGVAKAFHDASWTQQTITFVP